MDLKIKNSIELKKGKETNLYRKHPWVFSGALSDDSGSHEDGELVYVTDYKKERLGFGHYHNGSIAIKMLSFGNADYTDEFWRDRFNNALIARKQLQLEEQQTNCYRLIHGEGDQLPGLIIDIFNDVAVIQCHTFGMHRQIGVITESIQSLFLNKIQCIIDKSKESLPAAYAQTIHNTILFGEYPDVTCTENALHFAIDCLTGQKTGFFLDQRENRKLLSQYANGRTILNAFSYSGGFSIYALGHGAEQVHSVDVSQKALNLLHQNLLLNHFDQDTHQSICADVNDYLKNLQSDYYDLIVLDPPAFAKSIAKKHSAVQAYKRINLLALKKIKKNGLLFTFSCSQVVDEALFYNTIVSAGIESGRNIRVLHKLTQGPDHPVSLFHVEGSYLKGLVLLVD